MTPKTILANYRHILHAWPAEYHLGARTMALLELIDAGIGLVEADEALRAVEAMVEGIFRERVAA